MKRRNGLAEGSTSQTGAAQPAAATDDVPSTSDTGRIHWGSLHDNWQDGANACQGRPLQGKEPLPYGVLTAIAAHRVRAVPFLHDALDHDPRLRQRIGSFQRHARDTQGRTWDIATLDHDHSQLAVFEWELRRIVDAMRDEFDLV